jgi:hypothetical protein
MEHEKQRTPRLIKAADIAARKTKQETTESLTAAKPEVKVAEVFKAAAVRMRAPRDARDARRLFDLLFDKPARA